MSDHTNITWPFIFVFVGSLLLIITGLMHCFNYQKSERVKNKLG